VSDGAPETDTFLVDQEHFRGSLSELTHALRSHALEPERLDLLALVRTFLAYFERHAAADLEVATEALPRLAQVIELKVRLLLPRPPKDEDEVDEVSAVDEALEAVALLEELEEAIAFLRRRREERRIVVPARTPRPHYPRAERPTRASPGDLARLAGRYRLGGYFELAIERLTLAGTLRALARALRERGRGLLFDLLGARDWVTKAVGFAAMLELVREGKAVAEQDEPFGPIVVSPVPAAADADGRPAEEVAGNVDAASAA
jgi:segregation and condensation protein A